MSMCWRRPIGSLSHTQPVKKEMRIAQATAVSPYCFHSGAHWRISSEESKDGSKEARRSATGQLTEHMWDTQPEPIPIPTPLPCVGVECPNHGYSICLRLYTPSHLVPFPICLLLPHLLCSVDWGRCMLRHNPDHLSQPNPAAVAFGSSWSHVCQLPNQNCY